MKQPSLHRRLAPALATLLLAACSGPPELPLPGTLARDRLDLAAEASEPVVQVLVREGDAVAADQVLLQLDPARAQAQTDQARATRRQAERKLAELVRGPRRERLRELQAAYDGAVTQFEIAECEHQRLADLATRDLSSRAAVDIAFTDRELKRTQREQVRQQLAAALEGTTIEELDQARAALAAADASLRAAELVLTRLTVRAPKAGMVESLPFKLGERPGVGQTVVTVLASDRLYARIYVPETLRARVAAGLTATIAVDGREGELAGKVRFISSDAAYTPYYSLTEHDRTRLAYLAEVDLEGADAATLPAGVPVTVDFPPLHE